MRGARPWGLPSILWHSIAVAYWPMRLFMRATDAALFKVWWWQYPLDAWIERQVRWEHPEHWRLQAPGECRDPRAHRR